MDQRSIKSAIKNYWRVNGVRDVRYIKVRLSNEGDNTLVSIGIYIEKPISFNIFKGFMDQLSNIIGINEWSIYAPHGREIKLIAEQKGKVKSKAQS